MIEDTGFPASRGVVEAPVHPGADDVVLVTGAAGYLGSHAMVSLLRIGFQAIGVDSYVNSSPAVRQRIETLTGRRPVFIRADVRDSSALEAIFEQHPITTVMHFAGLKSVGESIANPVNYYDANVGATVALLSAMKSKGVRKLVFSSSCTIYGNADTMPIDEATPIRPISPYGTSKAVIEQLLSDLCRTDPTWSVWSLRYFNPIGADPSGLIGEDPTAAPTTLMPHVMRAALRGTPLAIYGDDYDTPDGTCIRDYIHVSDLIDGHIDALRAIDQEPGFHALNLGTGAGVSVLELLTTCCAATGLEIPHRITKRRPGDAAVVYADPTLAATVLQWRSRRTLAQACADHYRWHSSNPDGYPIALTDSDTPGNVDREGEAPQTPPMGGPRTLERMG